MTFRFHLNVYHLDKMAFRDTLILLLLIGLYLAFKRRSTTIVDEESVEGIIGDEWEFETVDGMISDVKSTVMSMASSIVS